MAKPWCSASIASPIQGFHSRKHDDEVQLYTFDVLMSVGDDLRPLPLHLRKNHRAKMLRRRIDASYCTEAKYVAPVHDTPQELVQPRYNKSWWPDQLRFVAASRLAGSEDQPPSGAMATRTGTEQLSYFRRVEAPPA